MSPRKYFLFALGLAHLAAPFESDIGNSKPWRTKLRLHSSFGATALDAPASCSPVVPAPPEALEAFGIGPENESIVTVAAYVSSGISLKSGLESSTVPRAVSSGFIIGGASAPAAIAQVDLNQRVIRRIVSSTPKEKVGTLFYLSS